MPRVLVEDRFIHELVSNCTVKCVTLGRAGQRLLGYQAGQGWPSMQGAQLNDLTENTNTKNVRHRTRFTAGHSYQRMNDTGQSSSEKTNIENHKNGKKETTVTVGHSSYSRMNEIKSKAFLEKRKKYKYRKLQKFRTRIKRNYQSIH